MKTLNILKISILTFTFVIAASCKKKNESTTIPSVETSEITEIDSESAKSGGIITDNGGAEISARGIVWNTNDNPTINDNKTTDGSGSGSFSSVLTGLSPNTKYFVRAYATNSSGTGYGSVKSFSTIDNSSVVKDADGNNYDIVNIGTQVWLKQDLKTTKFNDGSPIPKYSDSLEWANLTAPGLCWYNNDSAQYAETYGALYNWYAVNTDKLCPDGWKVPSKQDWDDLINQFGGVDIAAPKLREVGTVHWITNESSTDNESGFTALPGGARLSYSVHQGKFLNVSYWGYWWTTSNESAIEGFSCKISGTLSKVYSGITYKTSGNSVRCIKK